MDLLKEYVEDKILITSTYVADPFVVCIRRIDIMKALRLGDLAVEIDKDGVSQDQRDEIIGQLVGGLVPFIADVQERDGSPVMFDGRAWADLTVQSKRDTLVALFRVLVQPTLDEILGTSGKTEGKSLRRSEPAA